MFTVVYCHVNIPDVCCRHLDTNPITNKETNYNVKAVSFGYIYHKLTFKITRTLECHYKNNNNTKHFVQYTKSWHLL